MSDKLLFACWGTTSPIPLDSRTALRELIIMLRMLMFLNGIKGKSAFHFMPISHSALRCDLGFGAKPPTSKLAVSVQNCPACEHYVEY